MPHTNPDYEADDVVFHAVSAGKHCRYRTTERIPFSLMDKGDSFLCENEPPPDINALNVSSVYIAC